MCSSGRGKLPRGRADLGAVGLLPSRCCPGRGAGGPRGPGAAGAEGASSRRHEGREAGPGSYAARRGSAAWGPRFPRAERAEPRCTWRAGAGARGDSAEIATRAGRGRPGSWA